MEETTDLGSNPVPVWANSYNYVAIPRGIRNGFSCLAQLEAELNLKRKGRYVEVTRKLGGMEWGLGSEGLVPKS